MKGLLGSMAGLLTMVYVVFSVPTDAATVRDTTIS